MAGFTLLYNDGDITNCDTIVDCNGKVVESLEELAKVLMTQEFFVDEYGDSVMWTRSSSIDAFSIADLS